MCTKIMKIGEKNDSIVTDVRPHPPACRLARGWGVGTTAPGKTEEGVSS